MTHFNLEAISVCASVIAIAGAVFNNKKMQFGFVLWAMSNTLSAMIHIHAGLWVLAARDILFLALAIHGFFCWRVKS